MAEVRKTDAEMETIFGKLKIRDIDALLSISDNIIETWDGSLQDIVPLSGLIFKLGLANRAKKRHENLTIVARTNHSIAKYSDLNEKLLIQNKSFRRILQESEQQDTSLEGLKVQQCLEEKIKLYENMESRMKKHSPWIDDPTLDLLNMMQKTTNILSYREEKKKVNDELAKYQDLKPSINLAKQQVLKLIEEIKYMKCVRAKKYY